MKTFNWEACPNLSPKGGFLCHKPKDHSGLCVAQLCGGGVAERWHPDDTLDCMLPIPITITEKDIRDFGLKLDLNKRINSKV